MYIQLNILEAIISVLWQYNYVELNKFQKEALLFVLVKILTSVHHYYRVTIPLKENL